MIRKKQIWISECECDKCLHLWIPRSGIMPKICPKCKSIKWNAKYSTMSEKVSSKIGEGIEKQLEYKEEPIAEELKYILGEE